MDRTHLITKELGTEKHYLTPNITEKILNDFIKNKQYFTNDVFYCQYPKETIENWYSTFKINYDKETITINNTYNGYETNEPHTPTNKKITLTFKEAETYTKKLNRQYKKYYEKTQSERQYFEKQYIKHLNNHRYLKNPI